MKQPDYFFIGFILVLIVLLPWQSWFLILFLIGLMHKRIRVVDCVIVLILLLIGFLPKSPSLIPKQFQGKVIQIYSASFLLEYQNQIYQIYSKEPVILDSTVLVDGQIMEHADSSHFFSFDRERYQTEKRIRATLWATSVEQIQSSHSLRGYVQQILLQRSAEFQNLAIPLLLNQKITKSTYEILFHCGFHYIWILRGATAFLSKKLKPLWCQRIECLILIFMIFYFRFSLAVGRILFQRLMKKTKLDHLQILGLFSIIVYLINPALLGSISFLLPAGLQLLNQDTIRQSRFLFLIAMQSWYFYTFSLFSILLFRPLQILAAFCTLMAMLELITKIPVLSAILPVLNYLDQFLGSSIFQFQGRISSVLLVMVIAILTWRVTSKKILFFAGVVCVICKMGLTSPFGEVSFINVGQGDSILIRLPFNRGNVLIDTGKKSSWLHLESFLQAKGITTLDVVIITHPDEDHNGGLELLQQQFKVKQLVETYQPEIVLNDLTIQLLEPPNVGDVNERSLVCAFEMNGIQFLLMGDAGITSEKQFIEKYQLSGFDVIKLGHHGSNTSTSASFLTTIQPHLAIISSGVNNRYNHPHPEVLQRLEDYNIHWLNTQQSGDITITMTFFINFITTSEQQFAIMNMVIK